METRNYSKVYRILHWLIALTFILLLLTIFLRKTWMEKNHVAGIIQDFLADNGHTALSEDEAILLAKKIRKPMWNWHIYIGYVLTGLYCIRLAVPFFGEMKFSSPFKARLSTSSSSMACVGLSQPLHCASRYRPSQPVLTYLSLSLALCHISILRKCERSGFG